MSEERREDAERDGIHRLAAEWFLRLQDPALSLEETIDWQSWMSADERHARAFRRVEETWQRFNGMPAPPLIGSDAVAADRYDGSVPVSGWLASNQGRRLSERPRVAAARLAWAASVVAVVACGALALHLTSSTERVASSVIETGVGENRTVQLADGSNVLLGGHTRLEVSFGADARKLTLARGEAFFKVAKDPARPFAVQAGSATVTAVGTEFNVRRAADRVVVAVVEGRVLMEPHIPAIQQLPLLSHTASEKRRPRNLDAGNESTVDFDGIESVRPLAAGAATTAWQTGRLDFEREPLRYALESVNRYSRKPIVLGDERLGDVRITGAARSDNITGWVLSIESALGLDAIEEPDRIVLTGPVPDGTR